MVTNGMLVDGLVRRRPAGSGRHRPRTRTARAADERAVRARGRGTVARLLAAGRAEFAERGFEAVTVDDIARRADTSHGTFYLYFANKDDFFGLLAQEALQAMDKITDEFPVVTRGAAGRAALRRWVRAFCDTYQAHAAVIRILSQADVVGRGVWEDGLKHLLRLADVVSLGMTAGTRSRGASASAGRPHLTALACLMMLERVNYLLSSDVEMPRLEMEDTLTAIIAAAFDPACGALDAAGIEPAGDGAKVAGRVSEVPS